MECHLNQHRNKKPNCGKSHIFINSVVSKLDDLKFRIEPESDKYDREYLHKNYEEPYPVTCETIVTVLS